MKKRTILLTMGAMLGTGGLSFAQNPAVPHTPVPMEATQGNPPPPATRADAEEADQATKGDSMRFEGKVLALDKEARTITLEGRGPTTVRITAETKIKKGGADAAFTDLAVGDEVRGRVKPGDPGEAVGLKIGPETEAEKERRQARKASKQ